jgi:hypothetical protein
VIEQPLELVLGQGQIGDRAQEIAQLEAVLVDQLAQGDGADREDLDRDPDQAAQAQQAIVDVGGGAPGLGGSEDVLGLVGRDPQRQAEVLEEGQLALMDELIGDAHLARHRHRGDAVQAGRQPTRDRRDPRGRAASEVDRVGRQLEQELAVGRRQPGEHLVAGEVARQDIPLALIDRAVGVHRPDHRLDQEPARIVGAERSGDHVAGARLHGGGAYQNPAAARSIATTRTIAATATVTVRPTTAAGSGAWPRARARTKPSAIASAAAPAIQPP